VSDQNYREPGTYPGSGHSPDFRSYFASNLLGDPGSVENGSWHSVSEQILPYWLSAPAFGASILSLGVVTEITCGPYHVSYNAHVMIAKDLLEILVCPACKQALEYRQSPESLKCKQCHRVYAVKDDIPIMLVDEATIEP
jgi:hypothetical protein